MTRLNSGIGVVAIVAVLTCGVAGVAGANERPDGWITLKTKLALMTTEGIDSWDLDVDTAEGVVTLHGKVESDAAKKKAESVAAKIEGTRSVKNLLQVVPKPNREAVEDADDVVEKNVEKALEDAALGDVDVVSVNKGVVLLRGTVDTLDAHVKAVETVSRVRGVRRVSTEVKAKAETE